MTVLTRHIAGKFDACGNGGTGYCMNAWNGGPYVKMYYGGQTGYGGGLVDGGLAAAAAKTTTPSGSARCLVMFRGAIRPFVL